MENFSHKHPPSPSRRLLLQKIPFGEFNLWKAPYGEFLLWRTSPPTERYFRQLKCGKYFPRKFLLIPPNRVGKEKVRQIKIISFRNLDEFLQRKISLVKSPPPPESIPTHKNYSRRKCIGRKFFPVTRLCLYTP